MTREDPAAFAPPPAFGPFRVLHQIGVGALGPVFRTYEPTRDRLIAVKAFRLDIVPEQAQALADELSKSADAGLFHPSIVEPVAAGMEGTVAYRAEEYVAAESLDIAIRHYAPAPVEKVLPFITQLAGAIDFARAAGIGHGGLHLRDIFVTPEEARASGFGIVEALEKVGIRAPVRRPYTAPERVAGQPWSTPADVFSLAAITYEWLTGRRPAGTGPSVGPIEAREAGAYAAVVHTVLARAMDDDPGVRFPSALAFASALEAAARGEHVSGAVRQVGAIGGLAAAATAAAEPANEPDEPEFRGAVAGSELDDDIAFAHAATDDADVDDIAIERDEDAVYYDLAAEEAAATDQAHDPRLDNLDTGGAVAAGSLFEDEGEAADDLALDVPPEREMDEFGPRGADTLDEAGSSDQLEVDRFAGEGDALPSAAAVSLLDDDPSAARGYQFGGDETSGSRMPEEEALYASGSAARPGQTNWVTAGILVMLALLVGVAAGWALRGSVAAGDDPQAVAGGAAQETLASPTTGAAPTDTEQTVASPRAAPDAPPASPRDEAPAATPAPTSGTIVINSTPAKAGVTVNKQWRGRTPLTLDKQPFGTYDIRVVQEGYAVATERVVLSATEPSSVLSVALEREAPAPPAAATQKPAPATQKPAPATQKPAPATQKPPAATQKPAPPQRPVSYTGSIAVDSRPRGARVILNGKFVGTTPLQIPDLPIGSHVVRLELDDHRVWSTSARVQSGQETRVSGSLDPIR